MRPDTIRPREPPPLSLHLNHGNYCAIISRALISSPQEGYMVHAARASTASARGPLSTRHFLIGHAPIKNARNSPEYNALYFSNRLKTANCSARFSRVLRSKNHDSPVARHRSRFTTHQSLPTNHAFLIASRQILEIELTPSQQTRKYFLIASFSASLAPAPHLASLDPRRTAPFLFDTNKPHKIIILMSALLKTKEKQSSIRYKFAFRGTDLPAGAGNLVPSSTCFARETFPVLRAPGFTTHQSRLTNHALTPPRFSHRPEFMYSAGPMLDLGYVREHLDVIEKMARDRGLALDLAPFRVIDSKRRELIKVVEVLKAERNRASKAMGILMGAAQAMGDVPAAAQAKAQALAKTAEMKHRSEEIRTRDAEIAELDDQLKQFLLTVPNIPHASVPVGKSAADNVEVRRWG